MDNVLKLTRTGLVCTVMIGWAFSAAAGRAVEHPVAEPPHRAPHVSWLEDEPWPAVVTRARAENPVQYPSGSRKTGGIPRALGDR